MNKTEQASGKNKFSSCWTLTEGAAGMRSQVRGLAAALGYPQAVEKTCGLRLPWRWLPNHPMLARLAAARGDSLAPPWPDLLISCGRKAALLSMAMKRQAGAALRTVHIQDPKVAARWFDIVVVPEHDRLRGPNVLVSRGALHHVTPALLAQAATGPAAARLQALPKPRLTVLVGGPNRHFAMPEDWLRGLAGELAATARGLGGGLMISVSRRSPAGTAALLRAALADLPCDIWEGEGENPYLAYLALADAILVTGDSTSMTSEACAASVPVYMVPPPPRLPGQPMPARFARFHDSLAAAGAVLPWTGPLTALPGPHGHGGGGHGGGGQGFDDTAAIAAEIRKRLVLPPQPGG